MNDTIKYIMYIGSLPWVLSWIWPSLRYSYCHCSLFLVHCSLSNSTPSIRFSRWLLLSSSLNVLLVVLIRFVVIVSNTVTDMLINWRLERHSLVYSWFIVSVLSSRSASVTTSSLITRRIWRHLQLPHKG